MNARFWFTAGVLTGVAASAVVYLALRPPAALNRTSVTARAAHPVGTDSLPPETRAMSMEEATTRLEARLERKGGSADDWELLAKSYEFLRRPADAAHAREHTTGGSAAGGMPSMTEVAQLAPMDNVITRPPANGSEAAAPMVTAEITGTVSIEGRFADRVDRNAVLFIYAKAADSPGPPLAVLRLNATTWPVRFRLDDSMAMLPSRRLSQFEKVVVEARISRNGQATPAAGDLYVTSNAVSPGSGKKLALVINHEIG
jgi:hypothetical protein